MLFFKRSTQIQLYLILGKYKNPRCNRCATQNLPPKGRELCGKALEVGNLRLNQSTE